MSEEMITEPPPAVVEDTLLEYRVIKIAFDSPDVIAFRSPDMDQATRWMVDKFLEEAGSPEERRWRYQLMERHKIITREILMEL